jgi:hypothetical protein
MAVCKILSIVIASMHGESGEGEAVVAGEISGG